MLLASPVLASQPTEETCKVLSREFAILAQGRGSASLEETLKTQAGKMEACQQNFGDRCVIKDDEDKQNVLQSIKNIYRTKMTPTEVFQATMRNCLSLIAPDHV